MKHTPILNMRRLDDLRIHETRKSKKLKITRLCPGATCSSAPSRSHLLSSLSDLIITRIEFALPLAYTLANMQVSDRDGTRSNRLFPMKEFIAHMPVGPANGGGECIKNADS